MFRCMGHEHCGSATTDMSPISKRVQLKRTDKYNILWKHISGKENICLHDCYMVEGPVAAKQRLPLVTGEHFKRNDDFVKK